MKVTGYRCGDCEAVFLEPDGPLYECSSCGTHQIGEDQNRCDECHRFMSKLVAEVCPECESDEPSLTQIEAWRGADGELYESEAAEDEWIAGAPERARQKAASDAEMETMFTRIRADNRRRAEALEPKLRELLALIGKRAPRLAESVRYNLRAIKDDPDGGGNVLAPLYLEEMAELFAREHLADMTLCAQHYNPDLTDAERKAINDAEARIRAAIRARIAEPMVADRFDYYMGYGSAPNVEMWLVVDALIPALTA